MTGKDMRILIVAEDGEPTALLLQRLVSSLQAELTLVDRWIDALAAAASGEFDLVLADQALADGMLGERLRTADGSVLPVILIDRGDDPDRLLAALRQGVADVIQPPIDYDYLTGTIRRVVREGRIRRHEARRARRLRHLSRRLIRDRRELHKRVDLICRDLVVAYRRLAEKASATAHFTMTGPADSE
ncbi:MAG: hypothetical protein ACE5E1_03465 [Phycisphaerae bacterium]